MATKDQLIARATATEADRNEVFLQSEALREETFNEWLATKDITVPDNETMVEIAEELIEQRQDMAELKTHHHDDRYATKENEHEHSNKDVLDKITDAKFSEWTNKSNFSGSYLNLTDKPTIPTKVSQLTNDLNYVTNTHTHPEYGSAENDHNHNNKNVLDGITNEKVTSWDNKSEFSGNYNDLTNKPTIPSISGLATTEYVNNTISSSLDGTRINVLSFGVQEGRNVNIETNTQCLQNAIDFCKNNKTIVFPAGEFVFNAIDLGEQNNITIMGASSSFGSFAQKDIETGEITDTFTKIICNAPSGETFFKHKKCILIAENIAFYNLLKDDEGNFTDVEAKQNIFMQHTKSSSEGNNTEKGKVFLSNCAFFGWKVCFGGEFTLQSLEDELGTGLKASSYSYIKQSCVMAHRCRFTKNGVAINESVDARVIDCSFNKNNYGMIFGSTSGFSTVSNCRIEWNLNNGIYCNGGHEISIIDCEFDCNGQAGLYAINNEHSNFNNNIFRRNGARVETQDDDSHRLDYTNNVHIYADGNVNCIFMGSNTVAKTTNDVGSGAARPTNCTNFTNNTNCIITYNVLNGCTKSDTTDANKMSNNTNCITDNNIK